MIQWRVVDIKVAKSLLKLSSLESLWHSFVFPYLSVVNDYSLAAGPWVSPHALVKSTRLIDFILFYSNFTWSIFLAKLNLFKDISPLFLFTSYSLWIWPHMAQLSINWNLEHLSNEILFSCYENFRWICGIRTNCPAWDYPDWERQTLHILHVDDIFFKF